MVQFLSSVVVSLIMVIGVYLYMPRRPIGTPVTWGEAMAGSLYVFVLFFLVYGVVPHYWLNWADSELAWRPDRIVYGPGDILKPEASGGWLPFTISYQTIRDLIAVVIYGIALVGNVVMWIQWQSRGKKPAPEPVSEYGRPLVKEGV